jgi:metal-responsive CopG/Arc/MetJ family transcriptional regulator
MSKLVYITITSPRDFQKLMDRYAKKHYMKRSEFIRVAVIKYIEFLERKDPRIGDIIK